MASNSNSANTRSATQDTTEIEYVPNLGGFLTAHIVGQPYGEMSPTFIREVIGELDAIITVYNIHNKSIPVQFNGSTEHPMIVSGWRRMRKIFEINGNKILLMTYFGRNRFLMQIVDQEFNPNSLPTWHSYRTFNNDLASFDVTLTPYLISGSQLTLQKDFAAYLDNCPYKNLMLYGPQGDEFCCSIIRRQKSTKIGKGWKKFVEMNDFQSGEKLNFKFVNKTTNNIMKVVIVNT